MVATINPDTLIQFIMTYGYLAIFLGMVVEGPTVSLVSGFLLSMGFFNMFYVFIILIGADIVGDSIFYAIGYFGRKKFLVRLLNKFQISEKKLLGIEDFFKRHGGKSIFFSKFISGTGSWTMITTGVAKMNLKKFYKFVLIGAAFKSVLYLSIGYFFGAMYKTISLWLDVVSTIAILIILAILMLYFVKKTTSKTIKKLVIKSEQKVKKIK